MEDKKMIMDEEEMQEMVNDHMEEMMGGEKCDECKEE